MKRFRKTHRHGSDPFKQNSDRSDRKKWSTLKGGPIFSKLFRNFRKFLVEWIAPGDPAVIPQPNPAAGRACEGLGLT